MITADKITEVNGYKLSENWYNTAYISTPEQARESLLLGWKAADKGRGTTCHRCHGRGYTRKDLSTGCGVCCGTGVTDG